MYEVTDRTSALVLSISNNCTVNLFIIQGKAKIMAQFLFSKRYFYPQELNKCIVLKVVGVIASGFKTMLNTILYTLTLQTFIQKSNSKICNVFNLLSSTEQDYILLALYKHRTKRIYCLQEPTVQVQKKKSLHIN